MGKCRYCGADAGFLRRKHDECEQRHLTGIDRIKSILAYCFQHKQDLLISNDASPSPPVALKHSTIKIIEYKYSIICQKSIITQA